MAWIKRNLFFVIGGLLALGLLGAAGYYNYKGWSHNSTALNQLNDIYGTLRNLTSQKPSPGNDKINNIEAAKAQERQMRDWIHRAADYFQPIAPIPNMDARTVSSQEFAEALRRNIDQLQHEAETASVILPPKYGFSFEAERQLVKFATGSLGALAVQLGEVKAISEVFFAAHVNSLDGIQRVRVSDDDVGGPQADYFDDHSATNNLAVLAPYQITFRSFSPEIAQVLAGFASSPHGFIVKSISVQPAGTLAAASPEAPAPPPSPNPVPGVTPGRGGLQTVLNEQLLRVTLVVEIVKLLPQK
jgi:hypothetical protein